MSFERRAFNFTIETIALKACSSWLTTRSFLSLLFATTLKVNIILQLTRYIKSINFSFPPNFPLEMKNNRDDKILKAFGKKLQKLRKEKNLSTRKFADTAEIATSQVWVLETGQGDPSLTTLLAIAKALDVSLNDLDPTHKD